MATLICAHRGASHQFPENSLRAVLRAVELNADAVEIDVRRTRDGHLVACHDFSLSRLAGTNLRLSEITLAELKKLRNRGREPFADIPEILSALNRRIKIVFDVKERFLENQLLNLIHAFALEDSVIVSSFDPRIITASKKLCPEIKTALIAGPFSIMPLAVNVCFYLRRVTEYIRADYMHLCYMDLLYPGYKSLISWGYKISFWTVDQPQDIRNALSLNPQALITNKPDFARQIMNQINLCAST